MKVKSPVLTIRGIINNQTLDRVDSLLDDLEGDTLYLLIESGGGDPTIGYRVMRLLEAKYRKIISVIPAAAYSTATLMVLGTDEIYMRKSACLGPLDTQIEHPTNGSMVSSLEIRDSLAGLAGALTTYAEGFYETLKNDLNLGKKDAAELAMKTAADLLKPVAEKLDPIYLQIGARSSLLGQKYAEELLTARMLKGNPELATLVCRYLTNQYYYHGYAITLNEAAELLALNVKDVTALSTWEEVKSLYDRHKSNSSYGVYLNEIEFEDGKPSPNNAKVNAGDKK